MTMRTKLCLRIFLYGCHGNQAPANQVILRRNSNLENKIKNPETLFCRHTSTEHLYQKSCQIDVSFLSYVRSRNPSLQFSTF